MGILDTTASCFDDDDLLDFTLDGEGEEKKDSKPIPNTTTLSHGIRTGSFSEAAEEELEWLSNKDAFPAVETCFGILSDNPDLISNHHSPVSVLENTTNNNSNTNSGNSGNVSTLASSCDDLTIPTNFPVRARTNRQRKKRKADDNESSLAQQRPWPNRVNIATEQESSINVENKQLLTVTSGSGGGVIGRRCLHCQVDKTPQWRAGPMGPKTLCNACGVRYKSGRLLPEYRPANSPTFSSALHSNSHRKVIEMRKKKQLGSG